MTSVREIPNYTREIPNYTREIPNYTREIPTYAQRTVGNFSEEPSYTRETPNYSRYSSILDDKHNWGFSTLRRRHSRNGYP